MSDVPMPQGLSQEAVARMLRAAWIADEPIPAAGSFDEIGPLMRKAWMATARAVLALVAQERSRAIADATAQVEAKVREGVRETIRVLDEIDLCDEDRAARAADRSQP